MLCRVIIDILIALVVILFWPVLFPLSSPRSSYLLDKTQEAVHLSLTLQPGSASTRAEQQPSCSGSWRSMDARHKPGAGRATFHLPLCHHQRRDSSQERGKITAIWVWQDFLLCSINCQMHNSKRKKKKRKRERKWNANERLREKINSKALDFKTKQNKVQQEIQLRREERRRRKSTIQRLHHRAGVEEQRGAGKLVSQRTEPTRETEPTFLPANPTPNPSTLDGEARAWETSSKAIILNWGGRINPLCALA